MKTINKKPLLGLLIAILSWTQAHAQGTVQPTSGKEISDVAMAAIITGVGASNAQYSEAVQACENHSRILKSEPTLQRLAQIDQQFQIASGLMKEKAYQGQFNTCALKSIQFYSLLLGLGHGTMTVRVLPQEFSTAPGCLFLHFFKEAKAYSDEVSKSLEAYQKGEDSPELCPTESFKVVREKLENTGN